MSSQVDCFAEIPGRTVEVEDVDSVGFGGPPVKHSTTQISWTMQNTNNYVCGKVEGR